MGERHPHAIGKSTREIWPEVWEFNKPIFAQVLSEGKTFHFEDQIFRIIRNDELLDAYFTLSYGPIWLMDGSVGGSLVTLVETTGRVREERLLRDSRESPCLECMCGNIICGRTDPFLPFFTKGGSFWSNNTSELLASTSDEERQTRTRNRCNGKGYESVIPLHLRRGEPPLPLRRPPSLSVRGG